MLKRNAPILYTDAIIFLFGLMVSAGVFYVVRSGMLNYAHTVFESLAQDGVRSVSRELEIHENAIAAFGRFYEQSQMVTPDEFLSYTQPMMEHPGILSFEWIPRVRKTERRAFEARTGIQIKERNANGQLVAAGERSEYFPIECTTTLGPNETLSGLDQSLNPMLRAALKPAYACMKNSGTFLDRLEEPSTNSNTFAIMLPVYRKPSDSISERRLNLRGYILGWYDIGQLVEHAIAEMAAEQFHIKFEEENAASGQVLSFKQGSLIEMLDRHESKTGPWQHEQSFSAMGTTWKMTWHPTDLFFQTHLYRAYWWILPAGLSLTMLFVRLIHVEILGRLKAESLVIQSTTALQASEDRLRRAQQVARIGGWELNLATGMFDISREAQQIYGIDATQLTTQEVQNLAVSDYRHMLDAAMNDLVKHGKPYNIHFCIQRPSDLVVVEIHSIAEYDHKENAVIGIIQDVTEIKHIEYQLRQLAEVQSLILNNSTLGIALIRHNVFEWVNVRLSEMLLISTGELQNSPTRIIYPSEEAFLKTVRLAYTKLARNERFDAPIELRRSDGSLFWCRMIGKALDPSCPEDGSLWMLEDVTDQRASQEERLRLSTAIKHAAEAMVITDTDGRIEYVNPAFEVTTGYSREEALGQNPRLLASGHHDGAFYENIWQTIRSGQTWEGRFINKRKDGSLFHEEGSISPVWNKKGEITGYVAVKRDITEELAQETAARQSQKMEAVGQLAGGIAHDFNNILQAIEGFCGLLLLEAKDHESIRSDVLEIKSATKRAATLTRQLLDFSRSADVRFTKFSLNEITENQMQMLRRLVDKTIQLVPEFAPNLKLVMADRGQMEQIIMNLVVNARDAMPNGGNITIRTENIVLGTMAVSEMPKARPGAFVCLSVTDSGTGMDKEVLNHLFEPFFTTKKKISKHGTGLGLAIIYGIIEQHNGWIDVESEVGEGTVFRVYLPACDETEDLVNKTEGDKQDDSGALSQRILLVDDDPEVRKLTGQILKHAGYEVLDVASAEEALELFEQENGGFDLLFSDIVLPGQTGIQLADALRKKIGLRVLLFSGFSDDKAGLSELKKKGYMFMRKPFKLSTLLGTVHKVLQRRNS